jgi:hypothetical protein
LPVTSVDAAIAVEYVMVMVWVDLATAVTVTALPCVKMHDEVVRVGIVHAAGRVITTIFVAAAVMAEATEKVKERSTSEFLFVVETVKAGLEMYPWTAAKVPTDVASLLTPAVVWRLATMLDTAIAPVVGGITPDNVAVMAPGVLVPVIVSVAVTVCPLTVVAETVTPVGAVIAKTGTAVEAVKVHPAGRVSINLSPVTSAVA